MSFKTEKKITEDEMHYSAPDKIGNEVEVAIYARSASVDKRKIENQISDCKDFIKSIGADPEKAVIYGFYLLFYRSLFGSGHCRTFE